MAEKTIGKKGVKYLRRILFHYHLQNFVSNIFLVAALLIISAGTYTGIKTAYMIYSCTEVTEGHVEMMDEANNPFIIMIEEKFPELKKKYPVIRYDTDKGKYIHRSSSSVKVSNNTQFSAEVKYNPDHEDQAILSIEIFDQIGRAGVLILLGILIFVNSRFLHIPNWKNVELSSNLE